VEVTTAVQDSFNTDTTVSVWNLCGRSKVRLVSCPRLSPSQVPESFNGLSASQPTPRARAQVSAAQYNDLVDAVKPDLVEPLIDAATIYASSKRHRSVVWVGWPGEQEGGKPKPQDLRTVCACVCRKAVARCVAHSKQLLLHLEVAQHARPPPVSRTHRAGL
jgi:hypothetical protein